MILIHPLSNMSLVIWNLKNHFFLQELSERLNSRFALFLLGFQAIFSRCRHLLFGTEYKFNTFDVAILTYSLDHIILIHHDRLLSSTFRINIAISFLESGFNANPFIPIDFAFSSEIIVE